MQVWDWPMVKHLARITDAEKKIIRASNVTKKTGQASFTWLTTLRKVSTRLHLKA
jgi:hypothetical protein